MFRKLVLAIGATAVVGAAVSPRPPHPPIGTATGATGTVSVGLLRADLRRRPGCYIVKRTIEWRDGSLHVRRYKVATKRTVP